MSKPDVLMVGPMPGYIADGLDEAFTVHRLHEAEDREAFLSGPAGKVKGVATMGRADAALMDALPSLEIISSFGVGYDGVDVGHAASRGIVVTNTPDVLNDDVANLAITFLLTVSRRFVEWDAYVRDGRWEKEGDPPLAMSIRDKAVGILGLGRIGQDIARKLEVFGCRIAYHGRNERSGVAYRYYDDLTEMARDCDALIAICPGGEATRHLVNRQVLDALGPKGIFINISRGSVHDEDALIAALREGTLGAAGLDVFANEPAVPQALIDMKNVVLQPHQGSATVETRAAMGKLVIDNLKSWYDGKGPLTPVG